MMKKIAFLSFLVLFFLNFSFCIALAQTSTVGFDGNQIIYVDDEKEPIDINSLTGDILYQGEGIVLYEGGVPTKFPGRSAGACVDTEGSTHTVSRCADFTVPNDYPPAYLVTYPWVNHRDPGGCIPAAWDSKISDKQGNTLSEPYFLKAGETYTYCLDVTMAREECTINYSCLTPYLVKCPRAEGLYDDYDSKKGTPEAAYASQYACLASKACEEIPEDENSEIPDFVNYSFDWMKKHNKGNTGSDFVCKNSISCFASTGLHHIAVELFPSFMEYCKHIRNDDDIDKWTDDHEKFINDVIVPCFENNEELNSFEKVTSGIFTVTMVRCFRNFAQTYCRISNGAIAAVYPTPCQETLFSTEISTDNDFPVNEKDLLIPVGASIDVKEDNSFYSGRNNSIVYSLSVPEEIATISQSGILTIHNTYLPYQNSRAIIYVFVESNGLSAVGQYTIYDKDTDDDGIVDSAEELAGLNPLVKNGINSDLDNDGLSDIMEVMIKTSPLVKDSDGDGVNDFEEFNNGTDAANGELCDNKVQSSSVVAARNSLKLKAEQEITLNAGFHAQKNSSFLAAIEECSEGSTPPPIKITIDSNYDDWAKVPTISTNGTTGLNTLKVHDDCESIYVYINGNLDAHFQVFIDSDFNTTGANEFTRHYPSTGINFMMEDAYPYNYTGSGDDWTWNQTSLDTEPFAKSGNQLEMEIPKSIIPNLGSNINVGVLARNSNWDISGKMPDATAAAPYSIKSCNSFTDSNPNTFQNLSVGNEQAKEIIFNVFPNPFSQTTTINLNLPTQQDIHINLHDFNGRQLQQIANQQMAKGNHNLPLDATHLTPGFYYLTLESATETITRKIIIGRK